jgi:hypothetical protein
VRPAIFRAKEKLVQPVGELHHLERIPDLVVGPTGMPSRNPETLTTAPLSATTLAWL